jgi:hypothetical protein
MFGSGETIDYALGLARGAYRGAPSIAHGGADAGFRSFLLWLPEQRLGVAVLANLSSFDAGGAARRVVDAVIGHRLEAPAPKAPGAEGAADRPVVEVPARVLEEYVGAYQLEIGALVTIERRASGLAARLPDGNESRLLGRSETELLAEANGALLTFERAPGKPAPRFTARLGSETFTARRVEPIAAAGLAELTGRYWSDELETGYELVLEDGRLRARHARHPDIALYAVAPDSLAGDVWWFSRAAITRDDGGRVNGFRLTGSRVRNLRFERR